MNIYPTIRYIGHQVSKTALVHGPLAWKRHRAILPVDRILAAYPRSGHTWLRIMVYEALAQESSLLIDQRIPMVGESDRANAWHFADQAVIYKTHEHYRSEYDAHRAVYIIRDARDVVVSEYYYQTGNWLFSGDFDAFFDGFMRGRINAYGPWDKNVNSWLDAAGKDKNNILVVYFEDLLKNSFEVLKKTLLHLGADLPDQHLRQVIENNNVEQSRKKSTESSARQARIRSWKAGYQFVRSATEKQWTGKLSPQQLDTLEGKFKSTLLRCGYKLSGESS